MTTRRINLSITKDGVQTLADFDAICKAEDTSRSEALVQLMAEYVEIYANTHPNFGSSIIPRQDTLDAQMDLNWAFCDGLDAVANETPDFLK